jgi:plasmid stabilization system protein ParE
MAEIRWTPEAEKWLRDIYEYIARDNVSAAQRVVAGIYKKAQILKNFDITTHCSGRRASPLGAELYR